MIYRKNYHNNTCFLEDTTSYWRKKNKQEKSSFSMSQRHIGTHKVLTYGNLTTLQLLTKVSDYFFNLSRPLSHWQEDLDVSLLKKSDKIRPSELQTIVIFEADSNQYASLHFSKSMVKTGLEKGFTTRHSMKSAETV